MANAKQAEKTAKVGAAEKTAKVGAVETAYQVDSEGYSETFETKDSALKQAEFLKKRAVKAGDSVTISVKEKEVGGKGKEVHRIKIGDTFYK